MPTASAGTVMRGHDNRAGSIPGISMPPNHRFSTYRLSPPRPRFIRSATSYRSLQQRLALTLPSSSSYPRPDREREGGHALERQSSCTIRMVAMMTTKRKIAGLSPVHRIDTFDRVRIGDRVSTRDGSANESQWGRRERMIAPH